jgi:CRISPR-associated protein Cmr2
MAGTSNKVVCIASGIDPAALVATVRAAVQAELSRVGEEALQDLAAENCEADATRFRAQLGQVLECYGAWARWVGEGDAGYMQAYERANEMLDARKRLRDFHPNATAHAGLPLSSLDGAAETVLPTDRRSAARLRARFGIDAHEELDAIGLVKRVRGRAQGFPAVTRIALAPWIGAWVSDAPDAMHALDRALKPLKPFQVASENHCQAPDPAAVFKWDSELLLPSRRRALGDRVHEQAEAAGRSAAELARALADLEAVLCTHPYAAALGLPGEDRLYVALLQADGDRMGVYLSDDSNTPGSHAQASAALAGFADTARKLVFEAGGACIYAGGDDVLALCPVATAVSCARNLADAFAGIWPAAGLQLSTPNPTLSVGIAIAHVLTPFGALRNLSGRAKQLAKDGAEGKARRGLRNAMGLVLEPRGGSAVSICGRWDEPDSGLGCGTGLDRRLLWWTAAFASGGLSGSTPYDLITLAREVPDVALLDEAHRLVGRRIDPRKLDGPSARQKLLDHVARRLAEGERLFADAAASLADEWYVARWLAGHPKPPVQEPGTALTPRGASEQVQA